jgi:hypothetical protein
MDVFECDSPIGTLDWGHNGLGLYLAYMVLSHILYDDDHYWIASQVGKKNVTNIFIELIQPYN